MKKSRSRRPRKRSSSAASTIPPAIRQAPLAMRRCEPDSQLARVDVGERDARRRVAHLELTERREDGPARHDDGRLRTDVPRRGAHMSYCLGWLRTEENNYLSTPPAIAATLPRQAQELLGYAVHDSIPRGGGYLGMVRMQDPVDLLARGEL